MARVRPQELQVGVPQPVVEGDRRPWLVAHHAVVRLPSLLQPPLPVPVVVVQDRPESVDRRAEVVGREQVLDPPVRP